MTSWRLKCETCGNEWVLKVSYNLSDFKSIYHWCKNCKRNTFHKVLERIEE